MYNAECCVVFGKKSIIMNILICMFMLCVLCVFVGHLLWMTVDRLEKLMIQLDVWRFNRRGRQNVSILH